MHHHHHKRKLTKKEKHALARDHQRRLFIIFMQCRVQLAQAVSEPKITRRAGGPSLSRAARKNQESWVGKLEDIRNKVTNKRESARERWNRMAGTDEAGGRGL